MKNWAVMYVDFLKMGKISVAGNSKKERENFVC